MKPLTCFFVFKNDKGIVETVFDVVKMDYHGIVETKGGVIPIHGSSGIFCNTIEETFDVVRCFDFLMDNTITPEKFKEIVKTPTFENEEAEKKLLDFESDVIHNVMVDGEVVIILTDDADLNEGGNFFDD